ncbi:hypothetical protein BGZ76_002459 [Entomortierella beljakovae]|nr:hypothetical protein BGZ76_002459 [Entomortierella beljakovae]
MLNPVQGVLIDVSGTVHVGGNLIPGSEKALDRLRASGIPLNQAFRLLVESKSTSSPAKLIAVHKAKYFADGHSSTLSMGPGGFVEALEYSSGVKAHVVGKPQKAFFELAIQNMGLELPKDDQSQSLKTSPGIVMIGDDVEQDLGGGAAGLGLTRYLVQTGKYRAKDEDLDSFGGLDGTFADFAAAVDHILTQSQ